MAKDQAGGNANELPRDPEHDLVVYEDLIHLDDLWNNPNLSNKDIRLSSQIVRRLLLDSGLTKVASPRKLRLAFLAPDNKPLVRATDNGRIIFFQSAGTQVFGVLFRAITISAGPRNLFDLRSWDHGALVELRLDNFLAQPVFYFPASFSKDG